MHIKKLLPLIGIALLFYILLNLNLAEISRILSKINLFYAFLCFFVIIPLQFLFTFEWQFLLKKQNIRVSYWYSFKNNYIGYFYGFIIPWGAFGSYLRAVYLSDKSGSPLLKCFSNLVILNVIEYLAMLVLAFIGAIFLISVFPYLFVVILAVISLIIILYYFFFKLDRSRSFFKKMVSSSIFSKFHYTLGGSVDSFYEDLPGFKDVIFPFFLSILGFSIKNIILFFVAKLFFIEVPFLSFILIIAVSDFVSSVPVSFYGLGTREAALISLFSFTVFTNGITISPEQIVSLSLFLFLIFCLVPSIIGGFVTLYETKRTGVKYFKI